MSFTKTTTGELKQSLASCSASLRAKSLSSVCAGSFAAIKSRSSPFLKLSSKKLVVKSMAEEITAGVILGLGRVGQALLDMSGGKDLVVKRGESVPADSHGPIFVCTRNDALNGIVESTPAQRRQGSVDPA